jgi:sortase B
MKRQKSIFTGVKNHIQDYRNFKIYTILFAVLLAVALIVIVRLIAVWFEGSVAERGYRDLRQYSPGDIYVEQYSEFSPGQLIHGFEPVKDESGDKNEENEVPEPPEGMILRPDPALININSHYAGWIRIPNTRVDYPMVQSDNTRYLNTTFWGTHNRAGTIFLDERNPRQFDGTFVIIYGHDTTTGGMFGSLHNYTNRDYMARHPEITIFTRDGEMLIYRVVAAFETTIYDTVFTLFDADEEQIFNYFLQHGIPSDSTNFLVLSTCSSDNDRFLVLAAR